MLGSDAIAKQWNAALNRAEHLLFPRRRTSDRTMAARKSVQPINRRERMRFAQRVMLGIASVACALGFIFAEHYYSTTRVRIEKNPLVTNLTLQGFAAAVTIGTSPNCPTTSDAESGECWVRRDFDDSSWKQLRIPMPVDQDISSFEEYKTYPMSASVFYRMQVPITDALLSQPDEISFTPVYINHTKFSIFLNGRLVSTSNGAGALGGTVNIAIPRADIHNGKALIVVKGTMESELGGIASRAAAYVGPKALLDEIYVHSERANGTYHLLFLLSKGGIFVVFTLFFIFSTGQRGLYHFLVFAFFTTLENLFIGVFLVDFVSETARIATVFVSKTIAVNALLAYLATHFEVHQKAKILRSVGVTTLAIVGALVFDFGWGSKSVSIGQIFSVTNTFLGAAIAFGIILGGITLRMWRREGFSPAAIRNTRNLLIFLGAYLALFSWSQFFTKFIGFDKRALFDLILFYYMAFITANDLGQKEGQVRTLEAHMIEKRRMEIELQEAAVIARAFLPHSLPTWNGIAIRSFHRPLTENSGDWFAFESARGRRMHHFVMCDITGHGVQAAIVVSACKTVMSLFSQRYPEYLEKNDFIEHYAKSLNGILHQQGEGHHTATILGLTFDLDAGRIYHLTGGHPAPLRLAATVPPRIEPLTSRHNVLGSAQDFEIKMQSCPIVVGDVVLTYTDGLPLGPNIKVLREYMANRHLRSSPDLETLYDKVWNAHKVRTNQEPDDDVSIVSFTIEDVTGAKRAG